MVTLLLKLRRNRRTVFEKLLIKLDMDFFSIVTGIDRLMTERQRRQANDAYEARWRVRESAASSRRRHFAIPNNGDIGLPDPPPVEPPEDRILNFDEAPHTAIGQFPLPEYEQFLFDNNFQVKEQFNLRNPGHLSLTQYSGVDRIAQFPGETGTMTRVGMQLWTPRTVDISSGNYDNATIDFYGYSSAGTLMATQSEVISATNPKTVTFNGFDNISYLTMTLNDATTVKVRAPGSLFAGFNLTIVNFVYNAIV